MNAICCGLGVLQLERDRFTVLIISTSGSIALIAKPINYIESVLVSNDYEYWILIWIDLLTKTHKFLLRLPIVLAWLGYTDHDVLFLPFHPSPAIYLVLLYVFLQLANMTTFWKNLVAIM